jgi:hypothetical protein
MIIGRPFACKRRACERFSLSQRLHSRVNPLSVSRLELDLMRNLPLRNAKANQSKDIYQANYDYTGRLHGNSTAKQVRFGRL